MHTFTGFYKLHQTQILCCFWIRENKV